MKFLVLVCYDLREASSAVYDDLKLELASMGLRDYLEGADGKQLDIPSSTFIGACQGASASAVKEEISDKLDATLKKSCCRGTYLITVSNQWSAKAKTIGS